MWALVVALAGLSCVTASGQGKSIESGGGHEEDVMVDPSLHRFTGKVKALGKSDSQGRVVNFDLAPVGANSKLPKPGEWKGWRLKILTGQRFSDLFEIKGNTSSGVTIAGARSLDGLAVNDMFIIESIDAAGHAMVFPGGTKSATTTH